MVGAPLPFILLRFEVPFWGFGGCGYAPAATLSSGFSEYLGPFLAALDKKNIVE